MGGRRAIWKNSQEGVKMNHEYWKLHAFIAGGLLTVLASIHRFEMIDLQPASIIAIPLIVYLGISMIMVFKSFRKHMKENNKSKTETKVLKKIAKAKLKEKKKKSD
jgi:choline-glycine betaine transporter